MGEECYKEVKRHTCSWLLLPLCINCFVIPLVRKTGAAGGMSPVFRSNFKQCWLYSLLSRC